ncbi:MAG: hypothetical protein ACE367_23390 [Acidimicrobiales bacterium]
MIRLVDDQHLGAILRGDPTAHSDGQVFTTGYWYVRLCQAVVTATSQPDRLSGPFLDLPEPLRSRAIDALLVLPESIGLLSLRDLGPSIGWLRERHQLNILGMEALAAAVHLDAVVQLSARSPKLEAALEAEGLTVTVARGNEP